MPNYLCTDGNAEIEIKANNAEEAAQEYVDSGDWGDRDKTLWIDVRCKEILPTGDEEEWEWHTITMDPEEPKCAKGRNHDFKSPHSVLGGLKENPGCFGNGGGVIIKECCAYCGIYKITNTWAQNPCNGIQGLTSVQYDEADEISTQWVERRTEKT